VVRPGSSRAEVISGVLSAPSAADPVATARAFLATQPEPIQGIGVDEFTDAEARALTGGRGSLVKLRRTYGGLEVIGGDAFVRLDAAGRVRWIAATDGEIPAGMSTTPVVSADAAIAAVYAGPARREGLRALDAARFTRLVVWAPPGQPARLAWM